jgi:hypothetical protein
VRPVSPGRSVQWISVGALLATPLVLAFRTGGYLDETRLAAGVVAWLVVLAAAVAAPRPLPMTGRARLALAALLLIAAWTGASLAWAPLSGRATDDLERVLLYLGTLAGAVAWLRDRPVARLAEPALALTALAAAVYGLAGHLLPDLVEQDLSRRALGRLEQPLTYWNAMGALTALGLVLCASMAGDVERRLSIRAAALASAVPLGAALYLTYSRGALAALAVGAAALAVFARVRQPLVGLGAVLIAASAGGLAVAVFPAVADGAADPGAQGPAAFAVLAVLSTAACVVGVMLARRAAATEQRLPQRARLVRACAIAALAVTLVGGWGITLASTEHVQPDEAGANAGRLRSLDSQRYEYWRVALDTFASHPLAGVGTGGFAVEWLRERPAGSVGAVDAHSLYIETAAELGVIGLAALALLAAAIAACAARALRVDPALAAGPTAALAAFAFHTGLDWDWEMPALTLVALLLAAVVVAAADRGGRPGACNASARWTARDSQSTRPAP